MLNKKKKALILTTLSLESVGGIEKIAKNLVDLLELNDWYVVSKCSDDLFGNSVLDILHKKDKHLFYFIAPSIQLDWQQYHGNSSLIHI